MAEVRAKWLAFYSEHIEPVSKEIFSHIEKLIIGTLIVSAGAHVSSNEPAIVLFGYLRHGLVGRGVELFGIVLLLLNFLDGFYKLAKLNWHAAYQVLMSFCYIALSVRLVRSRGGVPCASRRTVARWASRASLMRIAPDPSRRGA